MNKLLILLLLSVGVQAQPITFPDPKTLATKEEVAKAHARIDSLNRVISGAIVTPPLPELKDCESGPDLRSITKISTTAITPNFWGRSVYAIAWRIYTPTDAKTLRSGLIDPVLKDTQVITFAPLLPGKYILEYKATKCKGSSVLPFEISGDLPPPVVSPGPTGAINPLGTWAIRAGIRTYTFTKHPDIQLAFNEDGTISDATPGITWDGTNTIAPDGRLRFYFVSQTLFENAEQKQDRLKDIYLSDGPQSIETMDCDRNKIPDYATFRRQKGPEPTENWKGTPDASMKYVHFEVKSDVKQKYLITPPSWFEMSAKIIVPLNGGTANFPGKRVGVAVANQGDRASDYQNRGYITDYNFSGGGANTSSTAQAHGLNYDQFYGAGRSRAQGFNFSTNALGASQFAEDAVDHSYESFKGSGVYPNGNRLNGDSLKRSYYKGMTAAYVEKGITNPFDWPGIWEYGHDKDLAGGAYLNWRHEFANDGDRAYSKGEQTFKESLTTKLFNTWQPGGAGWGGLKGYFQHEQFYRHSNNANYYRTGPNTVFWSSIYGYELFKLGTKTYQDQDRERRAFLYTQPYWEAAYTNEVNNDIIIRYPNGELKTNNQYTPASPALFFRYAVAGVLFTDGLNIWDQPGLTLGTDSTKYSNEVDQLEWVRWKPKGSSQWEKYKSGQNGAPIFDNAGIWARLTSLSTNAIFAGAEVARDLLAKADKSIELISYKSSLGDFVAKGGTQGFILNGHGGPANKNNFDLWPLKTKGLLFLLSGKDGSRHLFYVNENLPAHRSETVSAMGKEWVAYGCQMYLIPL